MTASDHARSVRWLKIIVALLVLWGLVALFFPAFVDALEALGFGDPPPPRKKFVIGQGRPVPVERGRRLSRMDLAHLRNAIWAIGSLISLALIVASAQVRAGVGRNAGAKAGLIALQLLGAAMLVVGAPLWCVVDVIDSSPSGFIAH